jgi:hypothetical protein
MNAITLVLVMSAACSTACAGSQTNAHATCPSGTVRVEDATFSGGTEIGSGFLETDTAQGRVAYRTERQNNLAFQCAFVCPTDTTPALLDGRVVCDVTSERTEVVLK